MNDLGPTIAWRALEEGAPVYDPGGKTLGVVERVITPEDIFEGSSSTRARSPVTT